VTKKLDVSRLRKRLNLSQAKLAIELGVNQSTVARLESGEMKPSRPVAKLLEQLAERASA
jgi:DNA-binding transcriptional regulator YiaG